MCAMCVGDSPRPRGGLVASPHRLPSPTGRCLPAGPGPVIRPAAEAARGRRRNVGMSRAAGAPRGRRGAKLCVPAPHGGERSSAECELGALVVRSGVRDGCVGKLLFCFISNKRKTRIQESESARVLRAQESCMCSCFRWFDTGVRTMAWLCGSAKKMGDKPGRPKPGRPPRGGLPGL